MADAERGVSTMEAKNSCFVMILRRQKLMIITMSGIKKDRVVLLGALSYVYFYAILVHLAKSEKYSRGFAP